MKSWVIGIIALVAAALFFMFCMRGYDYISYSLFFIAALIAVFHLGSEPFKRIVAMLTCIGLVWFCAMEFLIVGASHTDNDSDRGWLIVLGASVHGTEASLALTHRLEGALEYLESHPECRAVVSGGQGEGEQISEAQCMREWLIAHGIDENRIYMENKSTSTIENLRYSWQIISAEGGRADDIAVVSSGYHLYRAKALAKTVGIQAAGVKGSLGYPVYTLGMYIREAFGVTHLLIFGN